VANKRGPDRKGPEFWSEAVKRINAGANVTELAQELGISPRRLYRWRAKLEPREKDPQRQRETALAQENQKLKQALAEKVLEVVFLRGALHKVEERRQSSGSNGETASTTKSGK
jgi:transposase-like protein